MKKIITLIFVMLYGIAAISQTSGGPDAYGYTWKNSNHSLAPPAYSWLDISQIGEQVNGLSDDNVAGPFPIPAGFQFYWYPLTQFWIGSNGYISFNGSNMASPFPAGIPLPGGANNWMAPFLADLIFDANPLSKCYYYSNPDTLCISWINASFWQATTPGYTGSNTFQVIINRVDKSITFNYQSMSLGTATLDCITGIENNTGSLGLAPLIDILPSSMFTIKFYYPATVTYAVTDAGVNWNTNSKNAGIFVNRLGTPLVLKTNVKNYGNQNLGSFTVSNTILNSANISITNGSVIIPSLAAGHDTLVTYANSFVAPLAGTYKLTSSISGVVGDMVPNNNSLQQEIIAIDSTQAIVTLDYSDGMPDGTGLGWSGGNGGVGTYIIPPFYPVKIVSSRFFITANATPAAGFFVKIFDDDGLFGGPGTLLDSVFVQPTSVMTGMYNTVTPANNNIVINDGGVYLSWHMGAENINIGRDIDLPISGRMFEVLNDNWAEYRDKLTEDFLMGINVQKYYPPVAPVANFSYVTANDPIIAFTDISTNGPTSWLWTFGDGISSTLQSPSHTYIANGSYQVCLKVSNPTASDSICKTVVVSHVFPVANFTFNTSLAPMVSFTDASLNNPTAWKWDFDDIGNDSSNVQNPVYTFKTTGYHNVCLTVSNAVGSSAAACQTVNITQIGPVASFIFNTSQMPTVSFTDNSPNNPTAWRWDFDDTGNDSSKVQNPVYTFKTNGLHNVCLIITNSLGTSPATCQAVNVTNIGIEDLANGSSLLVFPNPLTDFSVIKIDSDKKLEKLIFKCFTIRGEQVRIEYSTSGNQIMLAKGSLSAGSYLFEIYNDQTFIGRGKILVH